MERLIDEIRGVLGGGVIGRKPEVLAWEYAEACRVANGRLERVIGMLDGGGEIEALQAAEQSPRLADRVRILAFGDEGAWQDFCVEHGHEVAPALDARLLDRLLALYGKGLAANHPLYRDYRSAMLAKNEARAFELVTIIARLNPADGNAQRELARLRKKGSSRALGELGTALDEDNAERVLGLMAKVEDGLEEDYGKRPEWQRACRWRDERQRAEAFRRQGELVGSAERALGEGDWRGAAVLLAEHTGLAGVHGVSGDADLAARLHGSGKGVDSARREAERQSTVRAVVKQLELLADEVETRGVTPDGLTADLAVANLEVMAAKAREMGSLRGEVPEALRTRLGGVRQRLERVVASRRRVRRVGWGMAVGVGSVLLLGLAAYGWVTAAAENYRAGLTDAREAGGSVAVRKLLDEVAGQPVWIRGVPPLAAEAGAAEAWLAEIEGTRDLVVREMARAEQERERNFDGVESEAIIRQVDALASLVAKLPEDLKTEQETRLMLLENEMERMLQNRQRESEKMAEEVMDRWGAVLGKIDRLGAAAEAAALLDGWAAALAPLKEFQSREGDMLRLPAASESRLVDLEARLVAVSVQVEAAQRQLKELGESEDSAAFMDALAGLGRGGFREADMAQAVADAWPEHEKLVAEMLLDGDLVAFLAATTNVSFMVPIPPSAGAIDRGVVTALRSHLAFKDVWLLEWSKNGKSMRGFSIGRLEATSDGSKHRGSIAILPVPGKEPQFQDDRRIDDFQGEKLVSNVESPASVLLGKLRLDELLDDSGTRFKRSVIPLIDEVMAADNTPALARAFLLGRFFEMVSGREAEWGVPLSQRLAKDLREVRERLASTPVGGADWMSLGTSPAAASWSDYFAARKGRGYGDEIQVRMKVLREAAKNPPKLVGYVDGDGRLVATAAPSRRLVWGIRKEDDGGLKFGAVGALEPDGQLMLVAGGALAALSPLLSVEVPEEAETLLIPGLGSRQPKTGKAGNGQ